LSALDDTLAGIPVAFVVGDAIAGGVDLGAGSLANLSLGVPLAIDRVSGASCGVVAVAVAAAESASSSGVREDAHAGFGLAVDAGAGTVAGNLASGLFGVPHAWGRLADTLGVAEELAIFLAEGRSGGTGGVGGAERSVVALVVGSLGRNSGCDGLGASVLALLEGAVVRAELVSIAASGISSGVLERAAESTGGIAPLASGVVLADGLVAVSCANTLALAALSIPAAESVGVAAVLRRVSELTTLATLARSNEDAHEAFGRALGVREEPAGLLADVRDGIPHRVVHWVAVALRLVGEALRRLGDTLEGGRHGRDGLSEAAVRLGGALCRSGELAAVSVAEVESVVPLAEAVGEASVLGVSVVASALAGLGEGVVLAVAAGFAGRLGGASTRGNVATGRASTSTSVPLADTRVDRAGSIGGRSVASRNATARSGVPDAGGVVVASSGISVSRSALGGTSGTIPLADGLSLASIRGEARARLSADTRDGVPSARWVEVAGFLSEVSVLALLLAELSRGDPAAAGLSSAGSLTLDETAGLLADSLLTVPLAVGVVDATGRSGVLIDAIDFADV
jgi:hypothetical protein